MALSAALRERSRSLPHLLLCRLALLRAMGGGPRTFPGGLNKWQYKRMHEKLARDKERRLLQQEKQLYQARLRSEIRAKLAASEGHKINPPLPASSGFAPMSSRDHIKALADRFVKEGAEDLWNEDDGPISSPPPKPRHADRVPPLGPKKIVAEGQHLFKTQDGGSKPSTASFNQRRHYSAVARRSPLPKSKLKWRRNLSSEEDTDSDSELGFSLRRTLEGDQKRDFGPPRFSIGTEESEEEGEQGGWRGAKKKMMSRAALRNHDVKMTRRVPRHVEEEGDLSNRIQEIRDELSRRESFGCHEKQHETREELVLTQKR